MKKILLIVKREKSQPHYELHFKEHVEFWTVHGKIGESQVEVYSGRWKDTNKKILAIILGALFGVAVAVAVKDYIIPQTATLASTPTVSFFFEGIEYTDGETLDWGDFTEAETTYTYNLTVLNTGLVPCNVTFLTTGLPEGWSQTWAGNCTILQVDEWVAADLDVTTGTVDGDYSWSSTIHLEKA